MKKDEGSFPNKLQTTIAFEIARNRSSSGSENTIYEGIVATISSVNRFSFSVPPLCSLPFSPSLYRVSTL